MDLGLNLKLRCHINENGDGDRFVGIKADSENAMVYFPMGYQLPESEEDIRQDMYNDYIYRKLRHSAIGNIMGYGIREVPKHSNLRQNLAALFPDIQVDVAT